MEVKSGRLRRGVEMQLPLPTVVHVVPSQQAGQNGPDPPRHLGFIRTR